MTKKAKSAPQELSEEKLEKVAGALPAVQKVREAAARTSYKGGVRVAAGDVNGDG